MSNIPYWHYPCDLIKNVAFNPRNEMKLTKRVEFDLQAKVMRFSVSDPSCAQFLSVSLNLKYSLDKLLNL